MNTPHQNSDGATDNADADARITETLGRIGDRATPPPWSTIVERHQGGSRWAWLPSPRDRRLWAAAVAGLVALVAVGSALRLGADLFDGDATDIETIDEPEEVPDPPRTTTRNPGTDTEATPVEGADGLPVGCLAPEFFVGRELSFLGEPGWADIDGLLGPNSPADTEDDDIVWAVAAASETGPVTPTHLLVRFNGVDVLSLLEPGRSPVVDTPWPLGFDLDGDGGEELLAFEQANNFKRVEVYRLGDCSIDRVPIDGGAGLANGFPVDAGSSSCQDWCNVGLVCLPDGTLVSTESEPLDRSDGRGDHRWTKISWRLEGETLVEVSRETGVLDFDELGGIDVTNTVNCDVDRVKVAQPAMRHADEARAIAELLGADVLVGTTGLTTAPAAQGYVVVDGEVARYDDAYYRVVGVQGDALVTAGYGSRIAEGPRYDLQGRPIDCAPYPWFVEGTAAAAEEILAIDPIIQDDGGWALLIPGYELGDPVDFGAPLGFDALSEEWWEVPLYEVDCETGHRVRVPSTEGTLFPSLTGKDQEVEIFLNIERRGGTTLYFTGGEGFVKVLDADGGVILDTDMYSWQVSDDGSIIAAMDLDGVVRGYDGVTGEILWTNDEVVSMLGAETFGVGDRMIFAGRAEPTVAVVSISSGETLVTPTAFDNLFVRYAG